ncbi:hypothetical protein L6452_08271 [Arctium lappa]|uniref:Uncharacterized protein n=1 Tax=Arctium lappa TaxID=4217 RepID=A0ACB9DH58_ARCLA|nr:hypothetical protein L6452_08271 [Arctium lappa]
MGKLGLFVQIRFLFIRFNGVDLLQIVGIGGLGIIVSNYNLSRPVWLNPTLGLGDEDESADILEWSSVSGSTRGPNRSMSTPRHPSQRLVMTSSFLIHMPSER